MGTPIRDNSATRKTPSTLALSRDVVTPPTHTIMSKHFKLLNCVSPRQARSKQVKPWVLTCFVQDVESTCIVDTSCNISAVPLSLIQRLDLKLIQASCLKVTIADGSTYTLISMVDVEIKVCNLLTKIRASILGRPDLPRPRLDGKRRLHIGHSSKTAYNVSFQWR